MLLAELFELRQLELYFKITCMMQVSEQFQQEPNRFKRFQITAVGITLDCSKICTTLQAQALLK